MTVENKKFARILKEIGLFSHWKEERAKYYIGNNMKKENRPFFPKGVYFSSCISISFAWAAAKHSRLWPIISQEPWKCTPIQPTCDNILEHQELLDNLRMCVKNYFKSINNKG